MPASWAWRRILFELYCRFPSSELLPLDGKYSRPISQTNHFTVLSRYSFQQIYIRLHYQRIRYATLANGFIITAAFLSYRHKYPGGIKGYSLQNGSFLILPEISHSHSTAIGRQKKRPSPLPICKMLSSFNLVQFLICSWEPVRELEGASFRVA
jgi:hypothetical protein